MCPGLGAENIQQEAELVAIIGKTCRRVSVEDALDYVGGYTWEMMLVSEIGNTVVT
ncbi:MAG: hypothetical protein CM1200mP37_9080 [Chloroflexota bacterium]|nr:MAG: hypothetical protein CM1200mP37_9080 [Chloroflexota bacterium]